MSTDTPIRLSGPRDEMAGLPPEWKDFFTAPAGKIEWKVIRDLSKRNTD